MSAVARRLGTLLRWHRAVDNGSHPGHVGGVAVAEPRGYHTISDPVQLGIAIRELQRTHHLISQFADVAAEAVGVPPERAVGIRATAALVMELIRQAEARREELVRSPGHCGTEPLLRGGSITKG